jgi:hypothetical protein
VPISAVFSFKERSNREDLSFKDSSCFKSVLSKIGVTDVILDREADRWKVDRPRSDASPGPEAQVKSNQPLTRSIDFRLSNLDSLKSDFK